MSCCQSCVCCTVNVQHHSVAVLEDDTAVHSGGPVLSRTSCLVSTSLHLIPPLPVLLDYSGADKTNQWLHIRISEHRSGHTHTQSRWQVCSCQELQQVLVRTDTVLFCATDKVLPPLKIARPSTPETLHCCIGFSVHRVVFQQPPAMNKMPLWNGILSFLPACCVSYHLCLSSLITCRYQCTLWSTLFEQEQLPPRLPSLNSLFECGCWRNHDSPVTFYPHVYAHDHFKWLAFHRWILTHLSVALFHFHSMQIKHSDYQKEQHEPEQQCAPTSGRVAAAKKW